MQKIKKTIILSLVTCVFSLPSFGEGKKDEEKNQLKYSAGDFVQTLTLKNGESETNWTKNVIAAEGWGSPPNKKEMSDSQKKNLAYTAALVTARRNLLITLEGVRINSKTTVKDAITEESIIEEELDGFIKGSQVIKGPVFEEDGTVKVTVAVKIWGKKDSLAGIVVPMLNDRLTVVPSVVPSVMPSIVPSVAPSTAPSVVPSPVVEEKKDVYTSLIIDCSGLEIKPAMSPAIFSESGKEIYTAGIPVSPSVVIEKGVSRYYDTIAAAEKAENAGKKPLIIKAKTISGNFAADPVISDEDALKIMEANQSGRFLEKLNVLIVI